MEHKIPQFADKVREKTKAAALKARTRSMAAILRDNRGEQNSSTAGLVILAIVAIGLAVVWVNAKAPGFFSNLGDKLMELFNLK
ncbi:MAG TPA: hypothetical protein DIV41_05465 [Ruminococcaceae bacterium]|jgi:hypothetical protein|nr:hypothetical protein [Oscillospiraceae bacterium]